MQETKEYAPTEEMDLSTHELIGAGGENLVFVGQNRQEVVKVNYFTLREAQTNPLALATEVDRRNDDVNLLREYFGSTETLDHTLHPPGDAYKLVEVKLTRKQVVEGLSKIGSEPTVETLQSLGFEDDIQETSLRAVVSRQKFLPLDKLKTEPFSFESHDRSQEDEIVAAIEQDFLCKEKDITQYERYLENFFPSLKNLLQDKNLHAALSQFVTSLIRFTRETGRAIDFEGRENIFFIEDEQSEKASFVLMDVLQAEPKNYIDSIQTFQKKRSGEIGSESNIDDIVLPEVYQFWGLNLLAAVLGLEDRIDSLGSVDIANRINQADFAKHIEAVLQLAT